MQILNTDIAIVGGGGAGLRAAIAAAEADPTLSVTLLSKVYPMRSHTVAAEGGAAGVILDEDSTDFHFYDTVSGGDWLCDQDVVDYFVKHAPLELAQMERWGCPWARKPDGFVNVRRFGGMKIQRTWFAADKTGFHMLHTLFQTSMKYNNINRLDEYFVLDLLVKDQQVIGLIAIDMLEGKLVHIQAKSVILATGGAGRVYQYNTNGTIVTGDGMAMAYKHGVPLRDMEFVQFHPTGLPGSGILMTEGCRGEGGILINKDGYRYLQDYDLGPETPLGEPKNRYMELGPRDKLSQAFWHESQKGRTAQTSKGDVVYLDLRHLGEEKIKQRLPFIRELAKAYVGVDPVYEPVPVRPTAHYTMGGIATNLKGETNLKGLFAVGECSSVGLHGANRLGSNSLSELLVFGRIVGDAAAGYAKCCELVDSKQEANKVENHLAELMNRPQSSESWVKIREEMGITMDRDCGVYRNQVAMQNALNKLSELKQRLQRVSLSDKSHVYNTELFAVLELEQSLLVAEAMVAAAILRIESRGAHQRQDEDCQARDDQNYLKHSLAFYRENASPQIQYQDVVITKLPPATRAYGDKEQQEQA
ncbi:fumarate reductase (quinol) flavoprotein subunit [Zophobihabitans entericus]|uniref:Fumarate reductase flavoprotein subunit n=1 Tax=Zophobihabitans entericus TaxID=1635327 RepID=A0A6G9I976_9GAMM|nr:fumarate reductase (quinol) flavoprotein subunit [Zophobihabitans entericus]QIQ20778.1 fumarate reductase (quinol) flavoprotein subunit [Zophobihabitans entericus]